MRAGEVAEGETITTPFGTATELAMAMVTPEQSAPMIAATFSAVTRRSAAAVAAAASMQVESARTALIGPASTPASLTSAKANSALSAMAGVINSSGPVKPRMMPTFTASWAEADPAIIAPAAVARSSLFMEVSLGCPYVFVGQPGAPLGSGARLA